MGPFELLDYVGLDTSKFIIEGASLFLKCQNLVSTNNCKASNTIMIIYVVFVL